MTDIDLDKLEALADAATPGPWIYRDMRPNTYGPAFVDSVDVRNLAICGDAVGRSETHGFCLQVDSEVRMANAAFIAAANPATILDLIASARRDAEEIERLRAFAGRMIELVGTAFYDGFRDAIDREKWDDCYDYAAVKGSDYARDAVQKLTARAAHTGEG